MNVAIIGYGKMGRGIHALMPKEWDLKLVCDPNAKLDKVITVRSLNETPKELLTNIDLFFEFTEPGASKNNITFICNHKKGAMIVSGTTGWDPKEIESVLDSSGSFLLHSANFSVGINAIKKILKDLTTSLSKDSGFTVSITDIHHQHKKDSPSGTAKVLASIIEENGQNCPITSIREGEVPGIHTIKFVSEFETIELKHEVVSRQVLCMGAILSVKKLKQQTKPGLYSV